MKLEASRTRHRAHTRHRRRYTPDDKSDLPNVDYPILKAIAKYENHPSILRIKNYMKEKDLNFSFEFVDEAKISKEIIR